MHQSPFYLYGDGLITRDFIHVSDVAKILLQAGLMDLSSPLIVNVATGTSISTLEVLEYIKEKGYPLQLQHRPARSGEVIASEADITLFGKIFSIKPTPFFVQFPKMLDDAVSRISRQERS